MIFNGTLKLDDIINLNLDTPNDNRARCTHALREAALERNGDT